MLVLPCLAVVFFPALLARDKHDFPHAAVFHFFNRFLCVASLQCYRC